MDGEVGKYVPTCFLDQVVVSYLIVVTTFDFSGRFN